VGRGSGTTQSLPGAVRLEFANVTQLDQKTRRAVAQRVTKTFEDETGSRYGKQRVIASNSGFTVSTVSSPIFETRKLVPLIFP
jgi:hypothetical protein